MLKETGEAKGRKKNLPEHMQIELWEDIFLDYVPRLSYLRWHCSHRNFNSTQALKISSKRFYYDIALKGKIIVLIEHYKSHAIKVY